MSALKTIGIIGSIGGIGLIGYYFLNKQKPTISEAQIDELKGEVIADDIFGTDKSGVSFNRVSSCEYKTGESNPCAYDYIPFKGKNYYSYALKESKPYFRNTPYPSGKDLRIISDDCVELDSAIARITDRIAEQTRTKPNEDNRQVLLWYKDILEDYFRFNSCREKITKQRFLDLGKTATLGAIISEKSVLGASQKNQNIYLGIGAVVLILSAGILTSRKS